MKILLIAKREYLSTAMTKGFIIGAFILPAIVIAMLPLIVRLAMNAGPPAVNGSIAVLDNTGQVTSGLRELLRPEKIIERRERFMKEQMAAASEKLGPLLGENGQDTLAPATKAVVGEAPQIAVNDLDIDADLEKEKSLLFEPPEPESDGRIGLAVIDANAVLRAEGEQEFGGFQLFLRPKMDDRIIRELERSLHKAIRDARYAANDVDADEITAMATVMQQSTVEVSASGERESTQELTALLPLFFMILLVMSVMVGGQYLVTTTVEEKSSRVVEVLLSAVSPMQLMTGKILGQMCVGGTLLFIYSGLGLGALSVFALLYIVELATLVYLFVFFILAYFMIASLLAAVGSAVNEMREAQSLQTPVMMLVMLPYILWLPISRDPNSMLATVLSFIPPMSPFVMMMRVASTEPPPTWQIFASIGVGIIGSYVFVWFAAKVFRVGLLMYGKPPNFRTLIKWVRMA